MRTLSKVIEGLPHFSCGPIIKGFGRGSRELGIPTANFDIDVVNHLPKTIETGIYYGWASVDNETVYKMVMSIGWNPYYHNEHKSMETHILHNYNCDLYDKILKVCIVGYLRPEKNFESLDELITAIQNDINDAERILEDPEMLKLKDHEFFTKNYKIPISYSDVKIEKKNGHNLMNGSHKTNGVHESNGKTTTNGHHQTNGHHEHKTNGYKDTNGHQLSNGHH